ncbi:recombinase family protein, partial [Alsobacter sp. R-9]
MTRSANGSHSPSSPRGTDPAPQVAPAPQRTSTRLRAQRPARGHGVAGDGTTVSTRPRTARPTKSRATVAAGARPLGIIPQTLDEALALARVIVASGLVPRGFESPEACAVAILQGLEVGLPPLAALQRIAIVDGRPTIWGDAALALVRASGQASFIEERLKGTGPDDWCAVCTVGRRGEREPVERSFGVGDARRAGLWGRPGPWQQYPQRMLQMRARAFALRDAFPDVLGGLYLREEMEDGMNAGVPSPVPMSSHRPDTAISRETDRPPTVDQAPTSSPDNNPSPRQAAGARPHPRRAPSPS